MRYLGLDIGSRAIGLAVGEVLSGELSTIRAPKNSDFYVGSARALALAEIKKVAVAEKVEALVVGLPVNEDGQPTEESAKIRSFCQELEKTTSLPIYFVDETLTSFMAADMLESQGADAAETARRVHQLSAELILQQYLEGGDEDL